MNPLANHGVGEGASGARPLHSDLLLQSGLMSEGDLQIVETLAGLVAEQRPEVLLALALALASPARGDVCAHLEELPEIEGVTWPDFSSAWLPLLQTCPLVTVLNQGQSRDRPFVLDGPRLYLERYFAYETRVAEALQTRAQALDLVVPEARVETWLTALFGSDESDQQRDAVGRTLRSRLTVLTGGPGTGKTYTVRGMLVLLFLLHQEQAPREKQGAVPRVALAAPTGKAAARMLESLRANLSEFLDRAMAAAAFPPDLRPQLESFLDGLEARTLHRLLGFQPNNPTRFRHHGQNPLPHEVVIVDETSMVDVAMMAKLLDAMKPETRLVLLGDADQLVSVECGSVLADLCSAGGALENAVVRLDRSRRFGSETGLGAFVQAAVGPRADPARAASLLLGRTKVPGAKHLDDLEFLALGPGGGLPREVRGLLLEGYRPYLELLRGGPREGEEKTFHRRVLESFEGFRVLCAHRRGLLGVEGVNRLVTTLLEREGLIHGHGEDWLGRPLLVTENDYGVDRYNGDIGLVVNLGGRDETRRVVAFPQGERGVSYLPFSRLPAYREAFALTIHKSQGSEFPHVLVVLPVQESRLASRELVYTGVTRARRRVTTLGTATGILRALGQPVRRASGLRDRLRRN